MINHKRSQLEKFLQEQIIGPGALKDKLFYLGNNPEFKDSDILYAPPASIYSSGIIFPLQRNSVEQLSKSEEITPVPPPLEEDNEENVELVEGNPTPMYNNTIGLSFVIKNINSLQKISLEISGRNYLRIKPKETRKNIGVQLDIDNEYFNSILETYESLNGKIIVNSDNICLSDHFHFETDVPLFYSELKEKKNDLREELIALLSLDPEKYEYLASIENFLYRISKKEKSELHLNGIEKIENINLFESYIRDLIKLERGSWISKKQSCFLNLSNIDFNINNYRSNYTYNKFADILKGVISDKETGLELSCNITLSKNRRDKDDHKIYVKVQLINTSEKVITTETHKYSVVNDDINKKCLFDSTIKVIGSKELLFFYNTLNLGSKDKYNEDETTKYLYRKFKDYGIGHNCSVDWSKYGNKIEIKTTFLPLNETPDVDTVPRNTTKKVWDKTEEQFKPSSYIENHKCLEIKSLSYFSSISDNQVIEFLNSFIDYYKDWITEKRRSSVHIPNLVKQELDKCEKDYDRIKKNIIYLDNNREYALKAFRLMNSAMFIQMWHSQNVKDDKVKPLLDEGFEGFTKSFYQTQTDHIFGDSPAGWRAFQLAFILLNIDGIINVSGNADWNERNKMVDLVWFPTGGGKTEAYLGIIAFTIIYRRLKNKKIGGGVSVIMRYTLRLLTLQQFQRATLLIMALELIRRWNIYDLRDEPITIGMWVGKNSLPNTQEDLEKEFESIDAQIDKYEGNEEIAINTKLPFSSCPCCGTFLFDKKERYKTEKLNENYLNNSIRLKCRNIKCSFSHPPRARRRPDQFALPVLLSDEQIYENPPTLLFGTVDKFALLAHKTSGSERHKDSRRIFGNKNCNWESYRREGYLPPDVIIQDELHLLSGPLGTAVALFENAIDQLCYHKENGKIIRPKVISSTATTRNTDFQIEKLYNREVNLFPKPGTDCDDSFFAYYKRYFETEESEPTYLSKRKYIGFLPTGRTQMWMQMRLLALCFIHRALFEDQLLKKSIFELKDQDYPEKAIDFYHTVISYFNSKKEVGKTSSQIDTYLIKEIRKVFSLVLRPGKSLYYFYCLGLKQLELTGRLSGSEVQKNLSIVEHSFTDEQRLRGKTPPDLVIATNMISVGIDVSRFNVILMNSMPRNIAEYIQASSRIGRNKPGLVLTLHHPFRSRDLSHFEKFRDFHEKFYSYVEPISITPFAEKAIRRYLNLYIATLIRQKYDFQDRKDANRITQPLVEKIKSDVLDFFKKDRTLRGTASALHNKTISIISNLLDNALNEWMKKSTNQSTLVFDHPSDRGSEPQEGLYIPLKEYETNIEDDFWKIPMSLRSVEAETVLRILNK